MKIVGIICEYNPLHNGHLHHLQKAKEVADGGVVIAILTGYFSMRGDVSVINKYDKIMAAINNGVDITIELPYLLGTQNADIFAYNAVNLLNKIGVDTIVSGSEQNDIKLIEKIAEIEKSDNFQIEIKNNINLGLSYRKSYSNALNKFNVNIESNDLLNTKYYQAIQKINNKIELKLIQRINNKYNDKTLNDSNIQSATTLRNIDNISNYVPKEINDVFNEKGFYNLNEFTSILKHTIITNDLSNIFGTTEGIENSFNTNFHNIDELIQTLSSKRYTETKIKRLISYIITNTKKDELENIFDYPLRVTGFNEKGRTYLNKIKKEKPYFTRLVNGINPIYDKELQIAKIYTNIFNEDFIKIEQNLPYRKK